MQQTQQLSIVLTFFSTSHFPFLWYTLLAFFVYCCCCTRASLFLLDSSAADNESTRQAATVTAEVLSLFYSLWYIHGVSRWQSLSTKQHKEEKLRPCSWMGWLFSSQRPATKTPTIPKRRQIDKISIMLILIWNLATHRWPETFFTTCWCATLNFQQI